MKSELDRLEANGIFTKILSATWASPTVNVRKTNGSLRICEYFSSTVNPYFDPIQTSFPTIDDVISRIGDSKQIFSKIDLCQAFLQIP